MDEKSEQQANIINSGQVDLWLQEHHQEMDELQHDLDILRATVSHQAVKLSTVEKIKIDRVIIDQAVVLDRESKRLKQNIESNLQVLQKLRQYRAKAESEYQLQHKLFVEMTQNLDIDVNELLDINIDKNEAKYWRLIDTRTSLESQIASLNTTVNQ